MSVSSIAKKAISALQNAGCHIILWFLEPEKKRQLERFMDLGLPPESPRKLRPGSGRNPKGSSLEIRRGS